MPDVLLPEVDVVDTAMAYREAGAGGGPTVLFLHGNPTSSYVWRDVLPEVAPVARCIAPDLVGFGQSGRPPSEYRFVDHVRWLDRFIERLGVGSAYLVAHDWGAALALHLAARRPAFVRGLALMEFIRPVRSLDEFHRCETARETFRRFRTPAVGEALILECNVFVDRVLPGSVRRRLTEEEMAVYRAPFPTPESRRPIWRLANELPIGGEPADVTAILTAAHIALAGSVYPKLILTGDPGALVPPRLAETFAAGLMNCRVQHLGPGAHLLPEDHPQAIGAGVRRLVETGEAARAGLSPGLPVDSRPPMARAR